MQTNRRGKYCAIQRYHFASGKASRGSENDNTNIPKELKKYPVAKETKRLTIDLDWTVWRSTQGEEQDYKVFDIKPYKAYYNHEFAQFSANVYNYLQAEVFKEQEKQNAGKTVTEKKAYNFFDELFYDNKMINPCIEILTKVEPQVIDVKNNFIGNNKGAFCVWINALKTASFIHPAPDKVYTQLLNEKFTSLNINESTFRKDNKRAKENYQTDIKVMLSQLSQSGK